MFTRLLREFLAGGKRVRPLLCCRGWRAAGGSGALPRQVAVVAASLELFHAFALVHDDIMDASTTRRGRPTVHRAFAVQHAGHRHAEQVGVNGALLLGDLALAWSYDLLHDAAPPAALWRLVESMRTETLAGQYLDLTTDTHTLAWARETGLVRSRRTLDLVASWRIGHSAACAYPRARGKYLDFIADWVTWALVFDDIFDHIVGEPRRVAEILARTRSVLHADLHTAPPQPLLGADRALRDLLLRAAEMTSPQWMTRFRYDMDTFFRGVLDKSVAIAAPGPVDVPTALAIRRDDIGMKPPLDFIEMFEEFVLPPVATGLRSVRWLRVLVCDAVVIQNDICSCSSATANRTAPTVR